MRIVAIVLSIACIILSALLLWQARQARIRNLSITIGYLACAVAAPPLRSLSELRAAVRMLRQAVREEPPGPVRANLAAAEAVLARALKSRETTSDEVLNGPVGDLRRTLQRVGAIAPDHPRLPD
jgi:hypothetical protein